MKRTRPTVTFTELLACAARVGGATIRWRESMRLGPIPEGLDLTSDKAEWAHTCGMVRALERTRG